MEKSRTEVFRLSNASFRLREATFGRSPTVGLDPLSRKWTVKESLDLKFYRSVFRHWNLGRTDQVKAEIMHSITNYKYIVSRINHNYARLWIFNQKTCPYARNRLVLVSNSELETKRDQTKEVTSRKFDENHKFHFLNLLDPLSLQNQSDNKICSFLRLLDVEGLKLNFVPFFSSESDKKP